jgi:hypothetical protein
VADEKRGARVLTGERRRKKGKLFELTVLPTSVTKWL